MHSRCSELESCGLFKVLEVTRRLGAPVELGEILQLVIEAALGVLDAERGTVFLYDRSTDELFSRVATGEEEIRFPASLGIAGESAKKRELINVEDCYADARFNKEVDKKTGFRTRCLLSIPLIGIQDELVGVLQVLNKRSGVFDGDDEELAKTLAAQCAVSLQRARLIEEQLVKQKLERDLAVARDIQLGILPKELPEIDGYTLACWSRPADDTGGDIYDATLLKDRGVAVLLADATGHGIGPALSVTQMRAMFRIGLRLGESLDRIALEINEQLKADLPGNRFITAFLGILDPGKHRLDYLSCGQGPLLHYHAGTEEVEYLDSNALPLAILPNLMIEDCAPMVFDSGDVVAVLSDGFFEYADAMGEQFEKQRVSDVIRQSRGGSADEILQALLGAIESFAPGIAQDDDMTAVILKRA